MSGSVLIFDDWHFEIVSHFEIQISGFTSQPVGYAAERGSSKDPIHHFAVDVGNRLVAAAVAIRQPSMIQPH